MAGDQRDTPAGADGAESAAVGRSTPADVVPRSRPPSTPRWLWIAALVGGAIGAIAFAVAAIRGGDSTDGGSAPAASSSSFPSGLILGAGIGLAIGWVLGRRSQSASHSERSRP